MPPRHQVAPGVEATDKVAAGIYSIIARDGAMRTATLQVIVKETTVTKSSPAVNATVDTAAQARIKQEQRALCVTADGIWGPRTQNAFAAYKHKQEAGKTDE